MPAFTLDEVLQAPGARLVASGAEHFDDVVTDTRKIERGCLFIALRGERFNGEDFALDAAADGAAGVVVSDDCPQEKLPENATVIRVHDTRDFYQELSHIWRMKFDIPVIAITGSNGKTTTKDITASLLSVRYPVLKTQKNFNNEVGLPLTLLGLKPEHGAAVVEIGMRGLGQIARLAPIAAPTCGIVTNVGETHVELLGSIQNVAKAKSEMVEAIEPGGTIVLNADNLYTADMRAKAAPGVEVIMFGTGDAADVRGMYLRPKETSTEFDVDVMGTRMHLFLPMPGRHNVENALAAISVAASLGFTESEIQEGLSHLDMTGMRFEIEEKSGCHLVNDAYNASPASMRAAFDTMTETFSGRKGAVLGDMLELGADTEQLHRNTGRELAKHRFSYLVVCGKLGHFIAEGACTAGMTEVYEARDHEEAARILLGLMKPDDAILFKGSRGMQMEKVMDLI